MESKINKYEQYKNDDSNDKFIEYMYEDKENYFLGYLFKTTLQQRRMFQGIINEYFYEGAKEPLKKLAADIGHKFIFGDNDKDAEIKFLAHCALHQIKSYLFFTKNKNCDELLPERNRVYFKKSELGFDFDTAFNLYHNLKLGQRKFYAREQDQITIMFGRFYEYLELRPKIYDFVIDTLKNHDLDNKFLHVIDHITGNNIFGMIKDKNKILNVLGYLKKDQKIDCEFIRLFERSFDLEADKTKEIKKKLMEHFDNNIGFNKLFRFVGGVWNEKEKVFFDPEIISKEQMKQIINNLKFQNEKDEDGDENKIDINTFFEVKDCLEKYNDQELVNSFRAVCKNKIYLGTEKDIPDLDVYIGKFEFVILNPELLDNENFKCLIKKLLKPRIDLLKTSKDPDTKNKKISLRADIYYDLKTNLFIRDINDKEIIDLFDQIEPKWIGADFEDIKRHHPEEFQAFCENLKDRLKRLKKTAKSVRPDAEHLKEITGELKKIIEIAPLSETQKDELGKRIENSKLFSTKDKIKEILSIIKDIVLIFRIPMAIEKIKNFGYGKMFSALSKIKSAIPATKTNFSKDQPRN